MDSDTRPQLLVVEDDDAARESLQALLEQRGYRVAVAENGREALRQLRAGKAPALILMDLLMPEMSGWEFLQVRAKEPSLQSVPVVVISAALDDSADLENVAGYLRKPVDPTRMEELISRLLSGKSPARVQPIPAEGGDPAGSTAAGPVRLLLIQDPEQSRITEAQLQESDEFHFQVRHASTVESAISEGLTAEADVLLLDLRQESEQGLTSLRTALRQAPGLAVVVLSGPGDQRLRQEALRLGAQDVLGREQSSPLLLSRSLHHAFERQRLKAALERARELAVHERERRGMARWTQPRLAVSSELLGDVPLRRASPETFRTLVARFNALCAKAVEEKEHELDSLAQRRELHALSDALAELRVGPGDIVDIYQEALAGEHPNTSPELEAARREEARLMLVGALGYVLASYRLYVGSR